jgi:hypothetical protein
MDNHDSDKVQFLVVHLIKTIFSGKLPQPNPQEIETPSRNRNHYANGKENLTHCGDHKLNHHLLPKPRRKKSKENGVGNMF